MKAVPSPRSILACGLALTSSACNHYEIFAIAGYEQASFSNDADVVFVVDNSTSMWPKSGSMGLNFTQFIDYLTDPNAGGFQTGDLSDAVDNYISFTTERGSNLDYRLAITTTAVEVTEGPTTGLDPGEQGTFIGPPPFLTADDEDVGAQFRNRLLCEATCWSETELPEDPGYECGTQPNEISEQYLNCSDVCGVAGWGYDSCGPGTEEHLEAALLSLCRSVENPPAICWESAGDFTFTENDVLSNGEFIRDDSTVVIVIVTDEGDASRRLPQAAEVPDVYAEAFASFGLNLKFAVIGPKYEDGALECNKGSATTWGIERFQYFTNATGGFYNYIADNQSGACENTDFSVHLQDLGALLNNLLTSFKLRSIPDESTIRAFIDGEEVPKANLDSGEAGQPTAVYDQGWSYNPGENAVDFWGDWVPDYNEQVRIIYRPLEGKPRELPF